MSPRRLDVSRAVTAFAFDRRELLAGAWVVCKTRIYDDGPRHHAAVWRGMLMHPFDLGRSITAVRASSVAAIAAATLVAAGAPSEARAADYLVWTCSNASGGPLGVGNWVRNINTDLADVQATCAEPSTNLGAFITSARATSGFSAGGGGWIVVAAPGTRITDLDVWWSWRVMAGNGAIRVAAIGNKFNEPNAGLDPFATNQLCCVNSAFFHRGPGSFGTPTANDPSVALSEGNHQSFRNLQGPDGPGTPAVALLAACTRGCGSREVVAAFQAHRVRALVADVAAPTGTATGPPNGLRLGSPVPVQASAADGGGGVREVTLRVDGQTVQRVTGGAGCADVDPSNADPLEYNLMKPCPSTLATPLTLTPGQMPDNEPYMVTTVATDAAGQDTILSSARIALAAPAGRFDARNGFYNPDLNIIAGRRGNGSNASAAARLTFGFARGRRTSRRRTARYATRPRIRGVLRAPDRKPVARARVWRATQARGGQWRISGRPLTTSRRGRVSARLPARSPSRKVRLIYFPFTDRNDSAGSPTRDLRVRATTTIHSDQGGYRNGDTLRFTGRVIRKRLIRSKTVFLQAIVRGKWRTFKTTRANRNGRWRMTHRFEATRRPTRYTFRAVVPSQTGYPWATGYSRRVRVLVTP